MYSVTFKFESSEDVKIFAASGDSILDAARAANVAIDTPCSGNATCGKCKVKLVAGEVKSEKTHHLSDSEWEEGYRLACDSYITGDISVLVPDISSAYRSRMKIADLSSYAEVRLFNQLTKQVNAEGITFVNDLQLIHLKLDVPNADDTMPDNERLIRALKKATNVKMLHAPYQVLKKLPDVLRDNNYEINCVTGTYKNLLTVIDVVPSDENVIYGLAIDIGTTSVSGLILDMADGKILAKASTGNGQIRYGADVINRIVESTKPGGVKKLQDAIIWETLNPLIENMCASIGIRMNQIYRMCVAGNTTMEHMFLGINADYLRQEPFVPVFYEIQGILGGEIALDINPNAQVIVAPNIGSYVGGDITAGTFATMLWNKPGFSLFIDLGTNGEIVFGNKDFLMSCACSAGPAFEGGDISCGMRATDGAVEKIAIDKETMEPTYSVIGGGKPAGICGSGIIDIIAELYKTGIISSKGKFVREGKRVIRDENGMGAYVVASHDEAAGARDVTLNEVDIDNFIRAKGAIFSAINIMLEKLELDVSVIERVYVAGGIGSGINMENAVTIGMFPDVPRDKFKYMGNTSLLGAYCMLLSLAAYKKVNIIAKNMTYIELSNENKYMEHFVAACFIPHTDAALFPSVKQE